MPIVFLPNPNGGTLGTGLPLAWNLPDEPIPDGAIWRLIIFGEGGSTRTWIEATKSTAPGITGASFRPFVSTDFSQTINVAVPLSQGQAAHATVSLVEAGVVISEATTNGTWDAVSGIPIQLQERGSSGSGGFTALDRQNLQAIEVRSQVLGEPTDMVLQQASGPIRTTLGKIFSRQLLDTLTLDELTSGPTSDPVRASIALWYYGVIVRVTTIAEDLVAKTPDLQWYFPDLAVLRVFRGVDLQYRRGIHTPTFMVEQPWQWGVQILNTVDVLGVPPDITIAVDWREGCAGQVFLQRLP